MVPMGLVDKRHKAAKTNLVAVIRGEEDTPKRQTDTLLHASILIYVWSLTVSTRRFRKLNSPGIQ